MNKFRELGLGDAVLEALAKKGFEEPTPIQEKTIPLLINGVRDIVGQAQTGTGKTAAFGLPLLELLNEDNKSVQALVLAPTRELAVQVAEEINSFKGSKKIFLLPVYGGQSYEMQIRGLKRGVQIVVGTPGRIRDHIEKKTLDLSGVTHVVLDEADEMLNMGFQEEVEEILKSVPKSRRMLLFSATMPPEILRLAKRYMKEYDVVEIKKEQLTTDLTEQIYFEVRESERFEALCRIIDVEPDFYGIVFCRTKVETDEVAQKLNDRGHDAQALHGDVTQHQREQILKKFKTKKSNVLVATDVAARGIDVNDLSHVINFRLPQDPEAYVHRIGRTGRAGKEGTAITLITPSELRSLLFIQKIARANIKRESLPAVVDVVKMKRDKVKREILSIIDSGDYQEYTALAHELIDEGSLPERALAALLKHAYGSELSEGNYRELGSGSSFVDQKGTARLFVALGRDNDMTPGKLVKFLVEEGGIDGNKVIDVKVFEKFSFITVPFLEAETLIAIFTKWKGSRKPLITKAKDRDGGFEKSYKKHDDFKSKSFESKKDGFKKKDDFKRKDDKKADESKKKRSGFDLDKERDQLKQSKPKRKQDDSDKFNKSFDDDLSW